MFTLTAAENLEYVGKAYSCVARKAGYMLECQHSLNYGLVAPWCPKMLFLPSN